MENRTITVQKNKIDLKMIRSFYLKLKNHGGIAKATLWLMVFITSLVVGNAQTTVTGYQYVSKIGGHIISSQSSLNVLPGQEIEYVVELYKTAAISSTPRVAIGIPFYASFYSMHADYYQGMSEVGLQRVGDSIVWNISNISSVTSGLFAKLTFTLVSSSDCYELNAACDKEITIAGNITIPAAGTSYLYGYSPPSVQTPSSTPVRIDIDDASFLSACALSGRDFRQFIYLEDILGTPIPLSDVNPYFPTGASFYTSINTTTGVPIGTALASFPRTVGKNTYYAHVANNCWYKFFINVLDTTNITFCAGETLEDARVWVSDWDAIANNVGKWVFGVDSINPLTKVLSLSDSGKILKYEAKALCGNNQIFSNGVKINVHDAPEITDTTYLLSYCVGYNITAEAVVDPHGSPVTYVWTLNGTVIGTNSPILNDHPVSLADNGKMLKLVATNSCGADSMAIRVNVYNSPIVLTCPLSTLYADIPTGLDSCSTVVHYASNINVGGGTNVSYTYQFSGATIGSGAGNGSGKAFNLGQTRVKIVAYNDCSIDSCEFDVVVKDKQAPYVTCVGNQAKLPATGLDYYTAVGTEFDATASDNCSGVVTLTHNFVQSGVSSTSLAGAKFYLGTTKVKWYAVDAAGNKDSCEVTVKVGSIPLIFAHPSTVICGDYGEVELSVINPDPAAGFATYQWYIGNTPIAGETDSFMFVNTSGIYSCELTYIHSGTKEFSDTIRVTKIASNEGKPDLASIPASGTICGTNGIVYLYVANTGDYSNPTYEWYKGHAHVANTESYYYATTPGEYYVVVVDGSCEVISDTITVTTNSTNITPPVISSISNNTICAADGMAILYLSSTHVGTSITYTWFKGDTLIPNSNRPMYEATEAGSYRLMMEIDGCAAVSNIIQVSKPSAANPIDAPTLTVLPSSAAICGTNGRVYMAVSNPSVYAAPTYKWYRNDTLLSTTDSFLFANRAGRYFVVVVDGGCVTRSTDVNVSVGAGTIIKPALTSYPATNAICGADGVVVLELTNSTVYGTPIAYQWYRNNAAISGANSIVYSAFTPGNYWLMVTTSQCVVVSDTIPVTQNFGFISKPLVTMSPSNGMISVGLSTAALTLTNASAYTSPSYRWYKDGLPISGQTNPSYVAADTGWYQLLVVDNNGCARWSDTFYVKNTSCVIDLPVLTMIPSTGQVCQPYGSVLIQLANLSAYVNPTFEWYLNGALISGETNPTIETTTAGEYRIRVTADISILNPNRCDLFSNPDTVTLSTGSFTSKPLVTRNPAGGVICGNAGSVLLTFTNLSAFPGAAYFWVKDGYEIPGATGTTILVTDTGDYQVLVVDGGCATLSQIEHISRSTTTIVKPVIVSVSGATNLCQGAGSLTLRVTNGGDYSVGAVYQWYKNGAMIVGATDNHYIVSDSGLYWVQVSDGSCSSASDSIKISKNGVGGSIVQPILAKQPNVNSICNGGEVMYTVQNSSSYSSGSIYIWFKDTGIVKSSTEAFYKATSGGIYFVQVSDGCNSVSAKDTLNSNSGGTAVKPIIASASGTTNICLPDGAIVLELVNTVDYSTSADYQWYKNDVAIIGATTPIYIAVDSGNYTLMVSDGGCSAMSDSVSVTKGGIGTILKPILSDTNTILCLGSNMLLDVVNTSDYSPNARYIWYNGVTKLQDSTLSVYEIDTAGIYWVLVVDGGCASVSDKDTVTMGNAVITAAQITALPQSTTICGSKGVVILQLTNISAYTNPTLQWYKNNVLIPGETRGIYEAKDSGSYRIRVIDGSCVSFSSPIKVDKDIYKDIDIPTMISQPNNVSELCIGGSKLLVVFNTLDYNSNARYVWYRNDDIVQDDVIPYYEVKQDGIYFVQVIDGDCSARSSWNDTIRMVSSTIDQPRIVTIPSNNNICGANGMVLLILDNPTDYASPAIQWYRNNAPIPYATGLTYEAYDTGIYRVQIVELGGTCTVLSDTSIKITKIQSTIEIPDVRTLPLSNNVCGDTGVVYLYVKNTYDYTNPIYQWYKGNTTIPGATQSYYSAVDSGLYRVFIIDGGCSVFSDTIRVTKSNTVINTPVIVSSTGGKIYGGNNVKLWLANEPMFGSSLQYYWFRNDSILVTTNPVAVTNVAGKYRLLLVDGGCAAWSNTIILIDTACNMPSLVVKSPIEICDSTSIDLASAIKMITRNGVVKYYADPAAQFELDSSIVSPNTTTTYYLQAWDTITGCYGSPLVPVTITVISRPILPNNVPDMVYIDGESVPFYTFTTAYGTVCTWSHVSGDAIVGLANSGTTPIPGFIAVNNTDSVIKATYMYTTSISSSTSGLTCNSPDTGYFNVELLPIPDVNIDTNNQALCSGDMMLPIHFTGKVDSTVFTWGRIPPISYAWLPISGMGDIQDSILYNNTGSPIVLSYQVKPTFTYRGRTSVGSVGHFTITVNPDPVINPIVPNPMEYCAGTTTQVVPFTGSPGLMYEWTKISGDSVGLEGHGDGNFPTFTAINPSDTIRTAVYEVKGTYLGASCMIKDTFSVSVYPKPVMNLVSDVELCNNDSLSVIFTGVANQYRWVRTSGNIPGIPSSGVGDMNFGQLNNPTQGILTASYKVTAEYAHSLGTCVGGDAYFTITLIPTPILENASPLGVICSGDMLDYTAVSYTQGGVRYSWTRIAHPDINAGNTSNGHTQFIKERLENLSDSIVTVVYDITLTLNGCSEIYHVSVDVAPSPQITIDNKINICSDANVGLNYSLLTQEIMDYEIIFSQEAKDAGFVDVTKTHFLTRTGIIQLMKPNLPPDVYKGTVRVYVSGTSCYTDYPFTITVLEPTNIVTQPVSQTGLCDAESTLSLSVQATGDNLVYQWYFEGAPIVGATDSVYEVPFTMDMEGEYYVKVIGTCGEVESEHVTVTASPYRIEEKWDDVLYIGNPDGLFVRYQWYKNGLALTTDANSQYYTDPHGFVGTYQVRAYYTDGTSVLSCPITLNRAKSHKMVLFPNPVRSGEIYKIQLEGDYLENSTLEVYDMLGKLLETHVMTGDYIELRAWYAAGGYSIRIITKDQGIKVKKLIVE